MAKSFILCLCSAALLVLSFPPFNFWLCAWIAFVPLFFALRTISRFKTFLLCYLTGVLFWLGAIYWLIHVTLLGMIILILYLALYFGIFGLLITSLGLELSVRSFVFIPAVWTLLEYARSHLLTGFGWALLGYSQYQNLPVIQIADITGAWGVSFLVMMGNVVIYEAVSCQLSAISCQPSAISYQLSAVREKKRAILLSVLIVSVCLLYGYHHLYLQRPNSQLKPLKVTVIQPNIPQELKWHEGERASILEKFVKLTRDAGRDRPDMIIWPEAAIPVVLEEAPGYYEAIRGVVDEIQIPLLFGAVTMSDNSYYNSAVLLNKKGGFLQQYNKLHLVPFGEYIPLRGVFPFLESIAPIGDIMRGNAATVFVLPGGDAQPRATRFSTLICFEDLFPEISRAFLKNGADFLVDVTNDAWYKRTAAPYQHLQCSVFRAVENGVYLIRAANTGISGSISPEGRLTVMRPFIRGFLTMSIPLQRYRTVYSKVGDVFIFLLLVIVLYSIFSSVREKHH